MKAYSGKQILSYLIYLLITVLIILSLYSLFTYYSLRSKYRTPQGNVIDVSPLTGETIRAVVNTSPIYSVTLSESSGIENIDSREADIIYESYDKDKQSIKYSYLVFNKTPMVNEHIEIIEPLPLSHMPKFNFNIKASDFPIYYKGTADIAFIEYSTMASSSFIYKEGLYHRITESSSPENKDASMAITASNLIIQIVKNQDFSEEANTHGNAIICSAGKSTSGKWIKEEDGSTYLLDYQGNLIKLSKGKSWWITVEEGTSVVIR